jgi:hypothetical protein
MKWKYIFSLKTRIYPQRFPNASAVTWSLVLQMRNLANKIEEFSKCDDFSGEISSAHWNPTFSFDIIVDIYSVCPVDGMIVCKSQ